MSATLTFDLQRIPDHGGILLSVVGMLVVFVGLTLVSLFIAGFPAVLDKLDRLGKPRAARVTEVETAGNEADARERERAVAIAAVLEHALTAEDGSTVQRLTIRRCESESLWRNAFWIRSLGSSPPTRKPRR